MQPYGAPGPASVQEHSSSGQDQLQGDTRCQTHREPGHHGVFLSHSGKQKGYVWDLFTEFQREAYFQIDEPFFDQENSSLPKGKEWPSRIFAAAKNCAMAVVILTEDYLTSKWPMLELLAFVDAINSTNPGMALLPVFMEGTNPSDLDPVTIEERWGFAWENIIGSSIARDIEPKKISLTVDLCKQALKMLRGRNGLVREKFKSDGTLSKAIVTAALELFCPSSPEMDAENIQGCFRLCKRVSDMFQEYKGIQCLGLYGMGGSGKTTMCKALIGYFGLEFNHKVCHLEIESNDSGTSKEKFLLHQKKHLLQRHKKLLEQLFGVEETRARKLPEPHKVLQQLFRRQPVFLAVDNVQEDDASWDEVRTYLRFLAPGSKIIITARSRYILRGVDCSIICKRIPNLHEPEAMALFLKIAAPEKELASLRSIETRILRKCLQICFFSAEEGAGGDSEIGHYHPLALRAVASYFRNQYSKVDHCILSWEQELEDKQRMILHSGESKGIFDILGIGFHKICRARVQLFIDVALYAPPPDDTEDIFNWLVSIRDCHRGEVQLRLRELRILSFLNYEDGISAGAAYMNINMHELYREYAQRLLTHGNEYEYGVYYDQDIESLPALTPTKWAAVPRLRLERRADVVKDVKEWRNVAVMHLFHCQDITIFTIGELVNLRHLIISDCSKLEVLGWTQLELGAFVGILTKKMGDMKLGATQEVVSSHQPWGKQLCFVELSYNNSLKVLPDFSTCSELRKLTVTECSSSVEPLNLHTCSKLQLLLIVGNDVPEVLELQTCSKLRSAQLAWKASSEGLLKCLPSLSELVIAGSAVVSMDSLKLSPVPGHNLFCKQHPKETVCYKLSGVWELKNLRILHLNYIPLGCLPEGLRTIGPGIEDLNLRGCLLSQLVDFSEFPNLQHLSIARTNVKEVRGTKKMVKLETLDFSFCFRLKKVPDLRRLPLLKNLSLAQCPDLQAIPRLPPGCYENETEDSQRLEHAIKAFASTAVSPLPPLCFAMNDILRKSSISGDNEPIVFKLNGPLPRGNAALRSVVVCSCCLIPVVIGSTYKAKPILTTYDLCSKCYTKKCTKDLCQITSTRLKGILRKDLTYNLCQTCFMKSGCDKRDFDIVNKTIRLVAQHTYSLQQRVFSQGPVEHVLN